MINLPQLTTDRLWLRRLRSADAAHLHHAFSDPECVRWWHRKATSSLDESAQVVSHMVEHNAGDWAVGLHGCDTVLGYVGFVTNLKPGGHAGFGYAFARSQWGNGYATEAGTAALDYAFNDVGIARAELWIHHANVPSIRLAKRLGCRQRSEAYLGYEIGPTPSVIYGITAAEWRGEPEPPPLHYAVAPVLYVTDVAAAAKWWQRMLQFEVGFIHGDPPQVASVTVCPPWTGRGGVQLKLAQRAKAGHGEVYVAVGPEIETVAEKAIAAEANVVEPLTYKPWGMREMELRDPDGNVVRLGAPGQG